MAIRSKHIKSYYHFVIIIIILLSFIPQRTLGRVCKYSQLTVMNSYKLVFSVKYNQQILLYYLSR